LGGSHSSTTGGSSSRGPPEGLPDQDNPTIKQVIIDGKEYIMDGYGSSTEYTFDILGNGLGKGRHVYYFYFEDGYGGSDQTTKKTFSIQKSKAITPPFLVILEKIKDHFPLLFQFC